MLNSVSITAVSEVFGDGRKVTAAVLEYPCEIQASVLDSAAYEAEDRTIDEIYVSDSPGGLPGDRGRFVHLSLDAREKSAETRMMIGHGPHGRTDYREVSVTVSQRRHLTGCHGEELPPFEKQKSEKADNGVADLFQLKTFSIPGTEKKLQYQLFCPKNYSETETYPLVLFLHDAGSCSDKAVTPLAQGTGAVVWAREQEQKKRPCFVAAPYYPSVCANDEFQVTWEADATVMLAKHLADTLPVDKDRIYGTGQSMGCMMLCELMLRNPDFFGGCLLVAGQWNPSTMAAAKNQNLWALVARGDKKAFPIMGACFNALEKSGEKVTRGCLDGTADQAVLCSQAERIKKQGDHLYFTWFKGTSILPPTAEDFPGAHHVYTWTKAYDIEALRAWLFEQRRRK